VATEKGRGRPKGSTNDKRSKTRQVQAKVSKIRKEFIYGINLGDGEIEWPTIEECAKRHKATLATARKYSMDEDWVSQREEVKAEITRQRDSNLIKERMQAIVDFDKKTFDTARLLQQEMLKKVRDMQLEQQYVRREASIVPDRETESQRRRRERDQFYNPFTPAILNSMSNVLANTQKVGRLALGESTENVDIREDSTPLLDRAIELFKRVEADPKLIDG